MQPPEILVEKHGMMLHEVDKWFLILSQQIGDMQVFSIISDDIQTYRKEGTIEVVKKTGRN